MDYNPYFVAVFGCKVGTCIALVLRYFKLHDRYQHLALVLHQSVPLAWLDGNHGHKLFPNPLLIAMATAPTRQGALYKCYKL